MGGISEPEFWDDTIPDSIVEATVMPRDCQRVLKTHLSFDMLPSQVMKRRNKVYRLILIWDVLPSCLRSRKVQ